MNQVGLREVVKSEDDQRFVVVVVRWRRADEPGGSS